MPSNSLPTTAKKNIETIAQVEQVLHGDRSHVERIGIKIAKFFGSLWFIAAHVAFLAVWLVLNGHVLPNAPAFDPFPFPFLSLVVGIEFIFLTTFVLINQNFQSKRQEHWGHLNLQVCMLAEQEVTKNMQMLHLICQQLGIQKSAADHREVQEMVQATPVTTLAEEIQKARDIEEAL